ncbi:uncharacterized protein BROUX77_005430 [Berkeleyomyces rouxiae]|uniref:uncharacterized protein n=1 Tax=Berkeleyomyces rouxiae TaxID=2035830 RepID=UPI003B818B5D
MGSEARLYGISPDTKNDLRKFRMGTSSAKTPKAVIYLIDQNTQQIKQDDEEVYTTLEDISDALPENSPRFVLLSYPVTLPDGRSMAPYILVYYMPATCSTSARMMYAAAKELMRATSEVGKVFDIEDAEDLLELPTKLVGEYKY